MSHRARAAPLWAALRAAIAYFVLVFALGFVLGTLRTILVANTQGDGRLVGALVELPIMLTASWFLCRLVVRRFCVPATLPARLLMGGLALVLLLLAEFAISALLFGRSVTEHLALYQQASYAFGLAAQCGFALIPALHLWRDTSSPT